MLHVRAADTRPYSSASAPVGSHIRIVPSDLAQLFVDQHRDVATKLDELSAVAKTFQMAEPIVVGRGLRLVCALCDELSAHIALEARFLVPALRNSDAWGELRAEELIQQLRARTDILRRMRKLCARGNAATLGRELEVFIAERWANMAHAEQEVLCAGILRDDVIGIDVDGG